MSIVSAFPLPPEDWKTVLAEQKKPEIPTEPFTCFGFEFNTAASELDTIKDTELKARLEQHFNAAVHAFKELLMTIGSDSSKKEQNLQAIESNMAKVHEIIEQFGRIQALVALESRIIKSFSVE